MALVHYENEPPYIQVGTHRIRLERDELTPELKKKAEKELRETPEVVENALREFRKLIAAETELYVPIDDDDFLIKFLRPCKFYPESAFDKMKKYYLNKKKFPVYCENLVPSKSRNAVDQGLLTLQEVRDNNGSRILIVEVGAKWVPSQCSIVDMFRCVQLGLEAAMSEPKTQVGGAVVLINCQGFSLTHVVQITPSFAKMLVDWIQECIPIRLKSIHVVNQPYIFNMVYALFKPFLREKLKKRLHFHGTNFDSLKKHVTPKALGKKFKGDMDMPEFPGNLLADLLCIYENEFILADSFGYKRKDIN